MKKKVFQRAFALLLVGALAASALPASAAGADLTRGQFVSALWEQSGKPSAEEAAPFTDVRSGDKNYTAILWAAGCGVVSGDGKGAFFAGEPITREQAAVMLLNYAAASGDGVIASADLSSCADAGAVSPWALEAVQWAVAKSLLSAEDGRLDPKGPLSAGEAAALVDRYERTSQHFHSIGLTGVENARQLGGYVTADGRTVKDGVLLRTGKLSGATDADLARLREVYNLTAVVDFRTTAEIAQGPDPAMEGVSNTQINILGDDDASTGAVTGIYGADPIQAIIDIAKSGQFGADMYASFLSSERGLAGYRQFFQALLNQKEGAILWHCTGGKDRAGTAAVLLLSALGVDRETVLQDFALTNDFNAQKILYMGAQAADRGESAGVVELVRTLTGVNYDYMAAMLDMIDAQYGSMDAFLTAADGMALTAGQLAQLREMYLD